MKIIKSFMYAFRGIWCCICLERNFRIHIVAAVSVIIFASMYGLPHEKYPAIIAAITAVMTAEAINTAVEKAIDLENKRNKTAEVAKDTAAAGVLLSAIGSVCIACFTFCDMDRLYSVLLSFCDIPRLLQFIVYVCICSVFVFFPDRIKKK